jgi:thiamine kinase-like enzyme
VLKVIPASQILRNSVELQMYSNPYPFFQDLMPKIYMMESNVNDGESWILMEHVQKIDGQCEIVPQVFDKIIPVLGELHSRTFENQFVKHKELFSPWLPIYQSNTRNLEIDRFLNRTHLLFKSAMNEPHLKEIIETLYPQLQKMIKKGPLFFPELIDAGQSIIHGDLHMQNICCNNMYENRDWCIQFVDWEASEYAPVWFDIALLVEILIDYRTEWHENTDGIRRHCVQLYTSEMKKHGITFKMEPLTLYKMALMNPKSPDILSRI